MSEDFSQGIEQIPDDKLIEVPKEFFFEGMTLPCGVFLKMKPNSYLVIGRKGDKAKLSNLHAFKHAKSQIYVRTIDYPVLISFVTVFTGKVIEQKSVPDNVKAKFISGLTSDAMTTLEKSGFATVDKIQAVGKILIQMTETVSAFDDIYKIIEGLPSDESKHAMTTCMMSLMIAEEMKLTQAAVFDKLAMGALLHDVGLKFVPKSVLDKPRHLWTPDEQQNYELHPLKGTEMLRDIKDVPMDVLFIVAEHHENAHGTGYPKRLRDVKISPLSKIVAVADYFSDLLFHQKGGTEYTPDSAITYIEEILGQPFNKQVFLALKNIVNKKAMADKKPA